MDLIIILIREYILTKTECIAYLEIIDCNVTQYQCVYNEYSFDPNALNKKKTRQLINVIDSNLIYYTNLLKITFDYKFNQSLYELPITLRYLTFGIYYNHKLPKLPCGLVHLSFGQNFNQRLPKLPAKLKYLDFGYCFNQ
jgi:hypothetical protein